MHQAAPHCCRSSLLLRIGRKQAEAKAARRERTGSAVLRSAGTARIPKFLQGITGWFPVARTPFQERWWSARVRELDDDPLGLQGWWRRRFRMRCLTGKSLGRRLSSQCLSAVANIDLQEVKLTTRKALLNPRCGGSKRLIRAPRPAGARRFILLSSWRFILQSSFRRRSMLTRAPREREREREGKIGQGW